MTAPLIAHGTREPWPPSYLLAPYGRLRGPRGGDEGGYATARGQLWERLAEHAEQQP